MSDNTLPGEFGLEKLPSPSPYSDDVPNNLRAATARLRFPPAYVVVGVYRLFTDKNIAWPVWQKCKHGVVRGAGVALTWVSLAITPVEKGSTIVSYRLF